MPELKDNLNLLLYIEFEVLVTKAPSSEERMLDETSLFKPKVNIDYYLHVNSNSIEYF